MTATRDGKKFLPQEDESVKVNVDNPCKRRHPVEELLNQVVAGDLPWSRATLKLGLLITSLSSLRRRGRGLPRNLPLCFRTLSLLNPLKTGSCFCNVKRTDAKQKITNRLYLVCYLIFTLRSILFGRTAVAEKP